jgi:transcriptional antiterminator NusG
MAETAKWYVVHTYSGYENTVKATIEKTIESRGLHDQILAISIPLETVTEITETGVSKTYDRKVYPGYVLVKMVYSDDTWHVIRNVRGVTGFVGSSSNDPTPLTEDEVYAMGVEKKEIIVNYAVGDTIRILDGPLSGFTGKVENIEVDKNRVDVVVSMFGRETSVEFELDMIEVVSQ